MLGIKRRLLLNSKIHSRNEINWDRKQRLLLLALLLLIFTSLFASSLFGQSPQDSIPAYREFPVVGSRVAMWVVGQLHLMFAAFILGVPMFAVIIEFVGVRTKDPRYDRMAKEFIKLCLVAFSTTALLGAALLFMLIGLYPKFFGYMTNIFSSTYSIYALLLFWRFYN